MDIKYVGSGTAAMAMIQYITNYIAKISLDSSTVFTALCAAIKAVSIAPPINPTMNTVDPSEQAKLLLLKTCNGMIGKRELSGQQVASFLCGIPNHFTNHYFDKLWWSSLLRFSSASLFNVSTDESITEDHVPPLEAENTDSIETILSSEDTYVLLDTVVHNSSFSDDSIKTSSIVYDILYCPIEFENLNVWEICEKYE